jgi:predicted esterase
MSQQSFDDFAKRVIQLHEAGEYAEAYDFVTLEASNFPEEVGYTDFWRACLAALLGRTETALQILQDWVATGNWVTERRMRDEPDLQSLNGLPEYEAIVVICRERHRAAEAQGAPKLITLLPEQQAQSYPLLLVLHGNNGNAQATVSHWLPAVARGWILAVPQSSQLSMPDAYVWSDRERATREIQGHYAALTQEYPINTGNVIVGGFSMGAGLAIRLTMNGAIPACGFISVGPYIPDVDTLEPYLTASKDRGLRGVIIVGDQDKHCYDTSLKVNEMLKAQDIPCKLEVYPNMGHDFPPDFEQKLEEAIAFITRY